MKKVFPILFLTALFALTACEGLVGATSTDSSPAHRHADVDRNGYCDNCKEEMPRRNSSSNSGEKDSSSGDSSGGGNSSSGGGDSEKGIVTVDFYSVNDMHGKFDDTYANTGVDEMTTYLKNAQQTNENTVVLSAGDMWQGSAESNFTKGKLVTEWMNEVGFSAMALGNHEFDWGEEYIERNEEFAQFPFLAINVYDKATNKRAEYCEPSVLVDQGNVQIGVIGAIGDCYSSIAPEQVEDVYFKVKDDLTSLVKAESNRLRDMGADMIVYVLHDSGNAYSGHYDDALSNGYVDLVFEGHSHQTVLRDDRHGVWHLQAGGDNTTGLSHATAEIDFETGEVRVQTAEVVDLDTYANLADDPIVDTLLEKYADELTKVNEQLGYNEKYRNSDDLANVMAKAMYTVGEERWGDESKYAGKIVLGGGFINVRSPYYLPQGNVTYGMIYPLFTFDNPLVLCKVTGERLKRQFIQSSNYYMYYGEYGQTLKNSPSSIVDSETYYVVVDTYCANYNFSGMGYMEIVEYYDEDRTFFSRDALAEYVKDGGMSASSANNETSISEILSIGAGLPANGETTEVYTVTGEITSIPNKTSGYLYIQDDEGYSLYVYRVYDLNGKAFGSMSVKPQEGDTVTLRGTIKRYVKSGSSTIELFEATLVKIHGTDSGDTDTSGAKKLTLANGFGGSGISQYRTGNYGNAYAGGVDFEYYRAYTEESGTVTTLLPYLSSVSDGTLPGSLYNVTPIYGIENITLTYKSETAATLYTGDDRVGSMTAHTLPLSQSYATKTLTIDTDNFFLLTARTSALTIKSLSIEYTGTAVSYNNEVKRSGRENNRLDAVTFDGTLVAGQSTVSVPVKVTFDGGRYAVNEYKTYTYYTLDYVESHPSCKADAAMTKPSDVAAYYTAFGEIPANYCAYKGFDGNSWNEVQAVFGDDARCASLYSRTDGYAKSVPYISGKNYYYELDIAVDSGYSKSNRSVGRVVVWQYGWDVSAYKTAPVCVYTDDHYFTFQEYLNTGVFGARFDAEGNYSNAGWSIANTW